jgi:Cys-rich protein (TIGR01571 family)
MWAWCGNCCVVGQSYALLQNEVKLVDPDPWKLICSAPCWLQTFFLQTGFFFLIPFYLRTQARLKYNIMGPGTKLFDCWGEAADDWFTTSFCHVCALLQIYKTLRVHSQVGSLGVTQHPEVYSKVMVEDDA